MSRRSDLRDAVVVALQERLPDENIESFIVNDYTQDDLEEGPRIVVRVGTRKLSSDQGPDDQRVLIEIGVIGATKERGTSEPSDHRKDLVKDCDSFDDLMDSVVSQWVPNGPLSQKGLAEHSFQMISQPFDFDPKKIRNEGIWLSMIQLTYLDSVDDED